MKHTSRLTRAAVATVSAAAFAVLAAAPAQAANDTLTFKPTKTERSTVALPPGVGATGEINTGAQVLRLGGKDRIETAILASRAAWADEGATDGPTARAVVLSRADEYADALGGAALAGAMEGPLLLTTTNSLRADVADEIRRLVGDRGLIYLLGGTSALSGDIEHALAGHALVRLSGADRYETSVIVAMETAVRFNSFRPQFVMATTGLDFPDGLAAGATAGGLGATVVLTRGSAVPTAVSDYLKQAQASAVPLVAVGGQAAAAPVDWDVAIAGRDRFETAAQVGTTFWGTDPETAPVEIGLATGLDWPDALAGGAFVAGYGPLMLTRPSELPAPISAATSSLVGLASPSTVQGGVVFGGAQTVSDSVLSQFGALLNG